MGFRIALAALPLSCGLPNVAHAVDGQLSQAAAEFASKHGIGDNSERLGGNLDSWMALAIVASSLLLAWALNHARPPIRTVGTLLSALGCLAVACWFAFVWSLGIVSSPKAAVLAVDHAKPAILGLQAIVALAAGLSLLLVAHLQSRRDDLLQLPLVNENDRYGRITRYLHWTTAALFLSMLPMGLFTSMIPDDAWFRQGYYVVHKTIGFIVLALVLIRLIWNLYSPRPRLDSNLKAWERRLAHGVHVALYVLMIGFPVTGFVMSTYGGKLSHFFIWDTPLFWDRDMKAIIPWALLHKIVLPYLAFLLIGAHVTGALKHFFIDRHMRTFRRMVT